MTRNVRTGSSYLRFILTGRRLLLGIQAARSSARSASRCGSAQARRSRMITCTCEGPSDPMLPPPTRRHATLARELSRFALHATRLAHFTGSAPGFPLALGYSLTEPPRLPPTLDKHSGRWALSLSLSLSLAPFQL